MVAINGLTTAAVLLRQALDNSTSPSPAIGGAVNLLASTGLEESQPNAVAKKSVSSAIFNAVMDTAEKKDKAIKEVLGYIDREYTQIEDRISNSMASMGDRASFQEAIARHKAAGEALREQVLADPDNTYSMLEKIKTSRPELSLHDAMAFLMVDLGKLIERNARAK